MIISVCVCLLQTHVRCVLNQNTHLIPVKRDAFLHLPAYRNVIAGRRHRRTHAQNKGESTWLLPPTATHLVQCVLFVRVVFLFLKVLQS